MKKALTNGRILTGRSWQEGLAVLIDGDRISGLCHASDCPPGYQCEDLGGNDLVPGFIDLQVNGGGGMMLNDARTLDDIKTIAAAHRKFGTTGMLPTLISDSWDRMEAVAGLIREAVANNVPGILGIHFEGPYLNPERKGVHDADKIRPVDEKFIELVTKGDLGHVLVTLAPEKVALAVIRELAAKGVQVSAGHSNASYEEMRAAIGAGLSCVTHLYNAMPPMQSRAPGLIGAALTSPDCFCGFINDGHHVHPMTLKAAIAANGAKRMMLVTDAMSCVGTDMTNFTLGDTAIKLEGGRLTTADGTLAGSALDMATAVRNTVNLLNLPLEEAIQLATGVPTAFLDLEKSHGRIAAGMRADLVLLDATMTVRKSWIGGQ